MPKKCRNCGTKIIAYPIWKGQEFGEPFAFNKINWRNLLIGDWTKLLVIVSLIFVAIAYGHDTKVCRDIYENPCDFITENQHACRDIIDLYVSTGIKNYSIINFDFLNNVTEE